MSDILYDLYFGKITPWEKEITDPFVKEAVKKNAKNTQRTGRTTARTIKTAFGGLLFS